MEYRGVAVATYAALCLHQLLNDTWGEPEDGSRRRRRGEELGGNDRRFTWRQLANAREPPSVDGGGMV